MSVPNPETIAGSLVLAISPGEGMGTKDTKVDFTKGSFTCTKFFLINLIVTRMSALIWSLKNFHICVCHNKITCLD